ncbi:MAG: glycerol-3-phosphate acyltransferase [Polaromonas sp.]|nr:glycerol-3-phosphate acyltransferase [Polaromonas sp.]
MADVDSVLAVLGAYLLGSLSFAVIVSRAMGLSDPRTFGSKNPGATNVLRSGSKQAAIATLVLDALKGWLPVWLAQRWAADLGWGDATVALVALAAFLGHLYPVFFRFKGGKGVATAAGVLFGVSWVLGVATLATFAIVVAFTRYVSLASVVAAVFAPTFYLMGSDVVWVTAPPVVVALVAMSALLVWRHSENINRLIQGKESRLGSKK